MSTRGLPPELLVEIFQRLDHVSVLSCRLVCSTWNQIARSDVVLQGLCQRLGFLAPEQSLSDLRRPTAAASDSPLTYAHLYSQPRILGRPEEDLASYEALLKSSVLLHAAWPTRTLPNEQLGDGAMMLNFGASCSPPAALKIFDTGLVTNGRPWRVKYDRVEDCFITTREDGTGLTVTCARTGIPLFFFGGVKRYSHLETSGGWVIHDTRGVDHFQIWRFERIVEGLHQPRRGYLRRFSSLRCPYQVRAYRFHFPILLVATENKHLVMFDIPTCSCLQDITMCDLPRDVSHIAYYVEFDCDFIFVMVNWPSRVPRWPVGMLQVYARSDGILLRAIGTDDLLTGSHCFRIHPSSYYPPHHTTAGVYWDNIPSLMIASQEVAFGRLNQELQAVHHDTATGSLLVREGNQVTIIADYKKVFSQSTIATPHQLPYIRSVCLLFGHASEGDKYDQLAVSDGRASFLCWGGIVVLDLRALLSYLTGGSGQLHRHCLYWHPVDEFSTLHFSACSSLQMDSTSITAIGHVVVHSMATDSLVASSEDSTWHARVGEILAEIEDEGIVDRTAWRRELREPPDNGTMVTAKIAVFDFDHLAKHKDVLSVHGPSLLKGPIIRFPGAVPLQSLSRLMDTEDTAHISNESEGAELEEGPYSRERAERTELIAASADQDSSGVRL